MLRPETTPRFLRSHARLGPYARWVLSPTLLLLISLIIPLRTRISRAGAYGQNKAGPPHKFPRVSLNLVPLSVVIALAHCVMSQGQTRAMTKTVHAQLICCLVCDQT